MRSIFLILLICSCADFSNVDITIKDVAGNEYVRKNADVYYNEAGLFNSLDSLAIMTKKDNTTTTTTKIPIREIKSWHMIFNHRSKE